VIRFGKGETGIGDQSSDGSPAKIAEVKQTPASGEDEKAREASIHLVFIHSTGGRANQPVTTILPTFSRELSGFSCF